MDVKFWPQSWSSYWHHFEDSKIYLLGQPEIEWGVGPPGPLEATTVLNNHKDDPLSTLMDTRNGEWWSVARQKCPGVISDKQWWPVAASGGKRLSVVVSDGQWWRVLVSGGQ